MLGKTSEQCFGLVMYDVENAPSDPIPARGLLGCIAYHLGQQKSKFYDGSAKRRRARDVSEDTGARASEMTEMTTNHFT